MNLWLIALLLLYIQSIALSVLFVMVGTLVSRLVTRTPDAEANHPAARWGQGYFVGLSAVLVLFVGLSRLLGSARWGFGVALVVSLAAWVVGRLRLGRNLPARDARASFAAFLLFVLVFSATNLVCWMTWNPNGPTPLPDAWSNFGSIHAGRYANYALLIAQQNRVPFLAQNMGQSMLAAFHLLLGIHAPLAALMVWIPHSLAALALLVYGTLRRRGLSRGWSASGLYFFLFCNIGLDWRALFVFDNGSPLGLIGYTDLILAVGTFLVFSAWIEAPDSAGERPIRMLLAGILGVVWCWYAPQNIVLAVPVLAAAFWARRAGSGRGRGEWRPLQWAALALAAGVLAGMMQLGPLLPKGFQEQTEVLTIQAEGHLRLRPYLLYMTSHWSARQWNIELSNVNHVLTSPHVYETPGREGAPGTGASLPAVSAVVVSHLASALRVYFFPLSALLLLALLSRGRYGLESPERAWVALAAFGSGLAIVFLLELKEMKWWLTRFAVPGTALCLLWGFQAFRAWMSRFTVPFQRVALIVLLIVATWPPLAELAWVFRENLIRMRPIDPMSRRLAMMVLLHGYFPG